MNHDEQRQFGQVNKTMHEWIERAAKIHFQRNHIADKELRRFFHFTKNCKQHLTRKIMFDRYKELRLKAIRTAPKRIPISRASLSVLVFYLYQHNRRALQHLVHCSRKFYPELKRTFLRVWLRVQLYCSRYTINRPAAPLASSSQTSGMNLLTSKMNHSGQSRLSKKRERAGTGGTAGTGGGIALRAGKRRRSVVKRYVPECKKFLDDKSDEDEEEVDLSANSGLEERSDDSDSEGSLCDFIVNDEKEESEKDDDEASSYDSGAKELELSDVETSCESDFSVYSD